MHYNIMQKVMRCITCNLKGEFYMAGNSVKLTVAVTKEIEQLLAEAKENWFFDRTQADMLVELIRAGLDSVNKKEHSAPKPVTFS